MVILILLEWSFLSAWNGHSNDLRLAILMGIRLVILISSQWPFPEVGNGELDYRSSITHFSTVLVSVFCLRHRGIIRQEKIEESPLHFLIGEVKRITVAIAVILFFLKKRKRLLFNRLQKLFRHPHLNVRKEKVFFVSRNDAVSCYLFGGKIL